MSNSRKSTEIVSEDKDKALNHHSAPEQLWLGLRGKSWEWDGSWSPRPFPINERIVVQRYIRADVVLGIIVKAGEEWSESARARKSKTYSAYAIAALDLRGRINEMLERAAESGEGENDARKD